VTIFVPRAARPPPLDVATPPAPTHPAAQSHAHSASHPASPPESDLDWSCTRASDAVPLGLADATPGVLHMAASAAGSFQFVRPSLLPEIREETPRREVRMRPRLLSARTAPTGTDTASNAGNRQLRLVGLSTRERALRSQSGVLRAREHRAR